MRFLAGFLIVLTVTACAHHTRAIVVPAAPRPAPVLFTGPLPTYTP